MVTFSIDYQGQLRCVATHGPSGTSLATDAPVDNMGKGESFSPTDLLATSLATCILTTIGIAGTRKGVDITGATATAEKHMSTTPPRRVARIVVHCVIPLPADHRERAFLEAAARGCPVHQSLHPETEQLITFEWKPA